MTHASQTSSTERALGAPPVDDRTYNVLQALTSTLEAMDAYELYAADDPDGLFAELLVDQRRHADRLLGELRSSLDSRKERPA
ncbi:MAG: hypothetical protein AB1627_03325 [Chloroflexota bacterium]